MDLKRIKSSEEHLEITQKALRDIFTFVQILGLEIKKIKEGFTIP